MSRHEPEYFNIETGYIGGLVSNDPDIERICALYTAALYLYIEDCRAALHDRRTILSGLERDECESALEDFLGPREQLEVLCSAMEWDTDVIAEGIMRDLDLDTPIRREGRGERRLVPRARISPEARNAAA